MLDVDYESSVDSSLNEDDESLAMRKLKAGLIYNAWQDLQPRNSNRVILEAIAWFEGRTDAVAPHRFIDCIDGGEYRESTIKKFKKLVQAAKEVVDARTYSDDGEDE